MKVNDKVPVYKKIAAGKTKKVGLIQIKLFQKGKCFAQILKQDPELRIEIGDFINNEEDFEKIANNKSSGRKTLPYLTLGTGLLASGLGYYFHDQANQAYKNYEEAKNYIQKAKEKTDFERAELIKEKTGVPLKGIFAINPANNERIPVWVGDYIIAAYGGGAVMVVPAHDKRDFEFALKYN